uniref:Zinc knuckle domain-like n=1 Tax=Oryza sativa subsp. japonica TaxID=39947 RepID=Q5WMV4_ORYSJ|nr:hypothetical protein [Oryza sativa Japonica Group]
MAAGPPAPIPSPPATLSPFQPYLNPPRTSSVRFRLSPPFLLAGIELAPSLSLSAVAAELRSTTVVAPNHLPPRRRLLRLRCMLADLVHPSVSLVDRRSAAVPVDPSRSAAFLRSGCLFVVAVDLGGAGAPPPAGRADVAAFGRTERLPRGARPSAARALGWRWTKSGVDGHL